MVTIKFFGRILPTGFRLRAEAPEVTWTWKEENISFSFRVYISNSHIMVECDLPVLKDNYIHEAYIRANDLSRACVNLAAFSSGTGLITLIDTIQVPDGRKLPINRQDIIPPEFNNAFSLDLAKAAEFDQVMRLVISEPPLFLALDDLIRSITSTHTAAADCGRAIDRIRRIISPTLDGATAWQEMHIALNISRDFQEWISRQSTGSRHGEVKFMSADTIAEITRHTFAIFNRFLEYRKHGNQPLTAPDFPELV
jgi:hypothetical protein